MIQYLADPLAQVDFKLKEKALMYLLIDGKLFRRSQEGVLLKCLNKEEVIKVIGNVHEGAYGAYKFGYNIKWLICLYRYYWQTIIADCFAYAKGCEVCQQHGPIQRVPVEGLHSIVKPWPFIVWAMDFIGKIYPPSSKRHTFIIVATDYFTKWVEVQPITNVS